MTFGIGGPIAPPANTPIVLPQNPGVNGTVSPAIAPSFTQTDATQVAPTTAQPNLSGGNWSTGGGATPSSGQPANSASNNAATGNDQVSGGDPNALTVSGIRPSGSDSQSAPSLGGGGSSGGSSAQPLPGEGGFLDNPLNPYAQIAYHWTLYAIGEDSSANTPKSSGKIIAETGKTGFNIDSVTMRAYIGPNATTRNSVQTNIKIEVSEAMGTSFLDGLVAAQQLSNVKNYQKGFYCLELLFKGYNQDGSVIDPITQGMPSNGRWVWKIMIQDISTTLNEGGARYTLDCVIIHDVALKQEYLKLQNAISVTGSTVGEFFQNLTSALNKSVQSNEGRETVTYAYKFMAANGMPDPSQYRLISDDHVNLTDHRARAIIGDSDRDKFRANLQRGQNLSELPELVVAVTKEGQSLCLYGDDKHTSDNDLNKTPTGDFRVSVVYRAYPQVEMKTLDGLSNNYKKTITFIVKPYQTQGTIQHPGEVNNADRALTFSKPQTRKRYDYIFTGKNTEITKFDIKFNFSWQAQLPRFAGFNYYTDQTTVGAIYPKAAIDAADKAAGQMGQASSSAAQQAGTNTQAASNAPVAAPTINNQVNSGATSPASPAQSPNQVQQVQQVNPYQQAVTSAGGNASSNFVEDAIKYASPKFNLVSFAQDAEGPRRAAGSGVTTPRTTRGRSVYGALLEQLYDVLALQNIDLEIRGDPFWLGGTYEDRFQASNPDQNAPDWTGGDIQFLLVFKYPHGLDEATGQPQFLPEQTYTGLYRATEIESVFKAGAFTQVLKGYREIKIDAGTAVKMNNGNLNGAPTNSSSGSISPSMVTSTTSPTGLFNAGGFSNLGTGLVLGGQGGSSTPSFAGPGVPPPATGTATFGNPTQTVTQQGGNFSISPVTAFPPSINFR